MTHYVFEPSSTEVAMIDSKVFLMELDDILPESFRRPKRHRIDSFLEWLFHREYGFNVVRLLTGVGVSDKAMGKIISRFYRCPREHNHFLTDIRVKFGQYPLHVVEKNNLVLLIFDIGD